MGFVSDSGAEWKWTQAVADYVARRFPQADIQRAPDLETPSGIRVQPDIFVIERSRDGLSKKTWIIECKVERIPVGSEAAENWIRWYDYFRGLKNEHHIVLAVSTMVTDQAKARFNKAGFEIWSRDEILGKDA